MRHAACLQPHTPRDTKLPCAVVPASVVLSGGSIAQISGDKALLLCQGGMHGNAPLMLLSSIAVFSGILDTER